MFCVLALAAVLFRSPASNEARAEGSPLQEVGGRLLAFALLLYLFDYLFDFLNE